MVWRRTGETPSAACSRESSKQMEEHVTFGTILHMGWKGGKPSSHEGDWKQDYQKVEKSGAEQLLPELASTRAGQQGHEK